MASDFDAANSNWLLPRLGKAVESEAMSDSQLAVRDEIASAELTWEENPCLCGARDDTPIAATDRYGLSLSSVLCNRCGVVRSDPYLTEHDLEWFYRERYRRLYLPRFDAEKIWNEQIPRGRRAYRRVTGTIAKPGHVLELGCSAGGILQGFHEHGIEVHGVDHDTTSLAFARARGIEVDEGGVESLLQQPVADLVIVSHVLEHLLAPDSVINAIRRSHLGSARLYIEVPGVFYFRSIYRYPGRFFHIAHVWHFTLQTLDLMMAMSGYRRIAGGEIVWAIYEPQDITAGSVSWEDRVHAKRVAKELVHAERWQRIPSRKRLYREFQARVLRQSVDF